MTTLAPRIDKIEDPSLQTDNSLATRLGQKEYLHGSTYNGGGAPTVTLSSGGGSLSSITRAVFIPYQMQDGSWRLKFNLAGVLSSTTRTTHTLSVAGITFKNGAGAQFVAGATDQTAFCSVFCSPNASTIVYNYASASTVASYASGDVELDSKPTWAY